jgi:hypothetical protein
MDVWKNSAFEKMFEIAKIQTTIGIPEFLRMAARPCPLLWTKMVTFLKSDGDARNIVSAIENAFQTQVVRVIPDDVATEYRAEIERRRQIGVTIDPAIAETIFWYVDISDPYCILDPVFHLGQVGREHFARNPGGDWVHFNDLPEATGKALWERDGRKLVFPHGLHPDDDVINHPPADGSRQGPSKTDAPQT